MAQVVTCRFCRADVEDTFEARLHHVDTCPKMAHLYFRREPAGQARLRAIAEKVGKERKR